MTNRFLYTIPITETNQGQISADNSKRVSSQSSLSTDFGDVQETGAQPGTRPVSGAVKGLYSDLITKELSELAQAPNYGSVVYFTDDSDPLDDAYVTVENFKRNPANPRTDQIWQYDGRLTEQGTNRSHYRAVETQPVSISNPFDGSGTDLIGLPATATKVSWYDEKGQSREAATIQSTITGRFNDVETYDPAEPSFNNPTLIAKVPYSDEGGIDARVWDDFDRSQLDGNSINSWQKVFATGHNFNGALVIENGLLRLTADEDAQSLSFEEWDTGTSSYSTVQLGSSSWMLDEINLTRISPTRTEGQMRFTDGSTFHTLDYQVNRASNRVLFITPTNEGSIPSGLSTLLSPIAEDWSNESQPIQKILARSEVNN